MRRIILLMAVAALVVVSALFVVSAAGAHKHPTARAHNNPTRTILIKNFSFKPAHITIKRGRGSDGSTRTQLRTPQRPTTEDRLTQDDWVKDRGIHTPSRARARSPTTVRYTPT
jgi:hypothetical protein